MLAASVCLSQLVVKKQTDKNRKTKWDGIDVLKISSVFKSKDGKDEKALFPDVIIEHGCAKELHVRSQCSPVIT